jgi:hypothetical protein
LTMEATNDMILMVLFVGMFVLWLEIKRIDKD